ncbi:MAG: hypothetical protein ACI4RT_06255 [Candidatus Spyradenecus sp.]
MNTHTTTHCLLVLGCCFACSVWAGPKGQGEARHASKVQEMQEIVDEMYATREARIEQNIRRFTDSRLRPGSRESEDGFLPLISAAENVDIAYTQVTCGDYAKFLATNARPVPKG